MVYPSKIDKTIKLPRKSNLKRKSTSTEVIVEGVQTLKGRFLSIEAIKLRLTKREKERARMPFRKIY